MGGWTGASGCDGLEVRRYRAGDEEGINAGFNRVFGVSRGLEEWHWKFPEYPDGRWIVVVVDLDGAIVAHFAAVPMPMSTPAGVMLAGQGADAYCRTEFRARGVYGRAVEYFFRHCTGPDAIQLFFGFAGERNTEVLVKYHGFDPTGQAPLWRRTGHPRRRWLPLGHEFREGFDEAAADALWERAHRRYPFAGVRNGAWWRRRFSGRPGVEYRHLSAWRRGTPKAWAVLRRVCDRVSVADWVWDGEDGRAVSLLDREVARVAKEQQPGVEEQWLAGDPALAGLLQEGGWAPAALEAPNFLVVRRCHERAPAADRVGDFYLTMGDADLV